jgi:hypothetical protein
MFGPPQVDEDGNFIDPCESPQAFTTRKLAELNALIDGDKDRAGADSRNRKNNSK